MIVDPEGPDKEQIQAGVLAFAPLLFHIFPVGPGFSEHSFRTLQDRPGPYGLKAEDMASRSNTRDLQKKGTSGPSIWKGGVWTSIRAERATEP